MYQTCDTSLVRRKYQDFFGASLAPAFGSYLAHGPEERVGAILGYRRAGEGALFLEAYLDRPVEELAGSALGRDVTRREIVEIGNFAAANALAMIELWGAAANDLAGGSEVAVATLTAPLRRIFARIGVPFVVLAPARPDRLAGGASGWGRYYESDPQVCVGVIQQGQEAIAAFQARRRRGEAA